MTPRIGRRPGAGDTREALLDAAREMFAQRDFEQVSVRAIASRAGVDPAMINHWFGTKEGLFQAAMELPYDVHATVSQLVEVATDEELPERIVRTFLTVWEGPTSGPAMLALYRRVVAGHVPASAIRSFASSVLVPTITGRLSCSRAEAQRRFTLVASQLLGAFTARRVIGLEPLASMTEDQVVAYLAPTVQRYLYGDLPEQPDLPTPKFSTPGPAATEEAPQ